MKVKPLADRVLVKPIEEAETMRGGIIIPDTAKERPMEGEIIAVGTGKIDEEGKVIALTLKKGDKVLYSKYAGTEIMVDGVEFLIMRESDVLATLEKEKKGAQ